MTYVDIAVLLAILGVLSLVIVFLRISKKKGKKCIGCPSGGCCPGCCSEK